MKNGSETLNLRAIKQGIRIKNLAFNYTIRRSQRAKKTRIIVTTEKIEVVAPLRVSERNIHHFVKLQQEWVISAVEKITKNKKTIKSLAPTYYIDGVSVPFQGEQKKIRLKYTASKKVTVEFDQQVISINLPEADRQTDHQRLIRSVLIDWMKQQAVKEVKSIVEEYAEKYNLHPRFIRVKTQKSRWGSCGIHNDININWLLILTPPKVMEYVVIHEICHIGERNHSANFWLLVGKYCPDYKLHRLWLKQNGRSIMQGL